MNFYDYLKITLGIKLFLMPAWQKLLLFFGFYFILLHIYSFAVVDCMNEQTIPAIAETKPMLSQQGLSLKNSIIDYADEMEILQKTIDEQKLSLDTLKQQIQGYKKAEGLIFECCSDEVFNGLYRYKRSDTGEPCINYLNRIYRSHGLEPPFEDL